jgi:hypothetical protein
MSESLPPDRALDETDELLQAKISKAWLSVRSTALIALFVHFLAGVLMAVILSQGLETNPSLKGRLHFLKNYEAFWIIGWLSWMLASLTLWVFLLNLSRAHEMCDSVETRFLHTAVFWAAAGIVADWIAEGIELALLPGLAHRVLAAGTPESELLFETIHRIAVISTGMVANGLYSLAVLAVTWATWNLYVPWIRWSGLLLGCFGLTLSAAVVINSPTLMLLTNIVLVPLLLLWLLGIAMHAGHRANSTVVFAQKNS